MKTTTKRKQMLLAFEPMEAYGQSYIVSSGSQKLGQVSYIEADGNRFVTSLDVEPYLQGFNIEAQILDALFADDSVKSISVVSDLSTVAFYQASDFVCDPKQVLLRKTK